MAAEAEPKGKAYGMKRYLLSAAVLVVGATGAAIAFAGLRIIQLPPEPGTVGETRIVLGVADASVIESPASYCRRTADDDPLCRMAFKLAIAREGRILLSLPYLPLLTPTEPLR
ncbi:hypothetical protein [Rhizobium sp.]